jgi:hypothetical protein
MILLLPHPGTPSPPLPKVCGEQHGDEGSARISGEIASANNSASSDTFKLFVLHSTSRTHFERRYSHPHMVPHKLTSTMTDKTPTRSVDDSSGAARSTNMILSAPRFHPRGQSGEIKHGDHSSSAMVARPGRARRQRDVLAYGTVVSKLLTLSHSRAHPGLETPAD